MTTNYWVEIRSTVQRSGPPRLVPLADVGKYTGFRTIAAFDDTVADLIRQQGGTHHLRGQNVYAEQLFMDFDSHDPVEFRAWLQSSGFAYEEWASGGRSVHFHIPLVPIFGAWVTDAMREWTKAHAPTADVSFLHNAGMYRLPYTYHHKRAGQRKSLVVAVAGNPLVLEPSSHPVMLRGFNAEGTREAFFTMLTETKNEGQRAPFAWRLATAAAEAGLDYDETLKHVRWWNARCCHPPRDDLMIQQQTQSAFKRLAKRHA